MDKKGCWRVKKWSYLFQFICHKNLTLLFCRCCSNQELKDSGFCFVLFRNLFCICSLPVLFSNGFYAFYSGSQKETAKLGETDASVRMDWMPMCRAQFNSTSPDSKWIKYFHEEGGLHWSQDYTSTSFSHRGLHNIDNKLLFLRGKTLWETLYAWVWAKQKWSIL